MFWNMYLCIQRIWMFHIHLESFCENHHLYPRPCASFESSNWWTASGKLFEINECFFIFISPAGIVLSFRAVSLMNSGYYMWIFLAVKLRDGRAQFNHFGSMNFIFWFSCRMAWRKKIKGKPKKAKVKSSVWWKNIHCIWQIKRKLSTLFILWCTPYVCMDNFIICSVILDSHIETKKFETEISIMI